MISLLVALGAMATLSQAYTDPTSSYMKCNCATVVRKHIDSDFAESLFDTADLSAADERLFADQPPQIRFMYEYCDACEITYLHCSIGKDCIWHQFYLRKPTTFRKQKTNYRHSKVSKDKMIVSKEENKIHVPSLNDDEIYMERNRSRRVKIPIGGVPGIHRMKRQVSKCTFPSTSHTFELDCIIRTKSTDCDLTCAKGYVYVTGRERSQRVQLRCNEVEGWQPHRFKECQPYVDCTVTLVTGGWFECLTAIVANGPSCSIQCYNYEDFPKTNPSSHTCALSGQWSPPLPRCVTAGSGIVLAQPPLKEFDTYHARLPMDSQYDD